MIHVMGAGAYGGALAVALALGGKRVSLWARDPAQVEAMRRTRRLPRLDAALPDSVTATADPDPGEAEAVLVAVPAQALRGVLDEHANLLAGRALVACSKGIDLTTLTGPSALLARVPGARPAVLTGPSFAAEIAQGLPTALTLAAEDGAGLQRLLSTERLRLYLTDDLLGAELGGALKNVVAIACGAAIGAGFGESARAALMTRGFAETVRLGTALGARAETFTGLSGLGDLALTCGSRLSRNFRYGEALGRGEPAEEGVTVEGAATARAIPPLAERHGLAMPVAEAVAALVAGETDVEGAMQALLARPLREEA